MTYPVKLNNRFANLKLSIETGDGRPTDQAYAGYRELRAPLDTELARLLTLLTSDLAEFNRLVVAAGLTAVEPP